MIIRTYKVAATDTAGAKIRARASNGREITVPYDYGSTDPHRDAAAQLVGKISPETCGRPVRWAGQHTRGHIFAAD